MSTLLTRAEALNLLSSIAAGQFIGIEGFQPMPGGRLAADLSYLYNEDVTLGEGTEIREVFEHATGKVEGRLAVARWLVLKAPSDYLFEVIVEAPGEACG